MRAGATERENGHIIECIEHYYSHLGIKPVESISATGIEEAGGILNRQDVLERAVVLGLEVAQECFADDLLFDAPNLLRLE